MTLTNRDTTQPEHPDASAEAAATSPWASLQDRNFRLFWFGGLISNTGRWFQSVAIPAIVWQLTESPGWVGLAGFASMAPMAFVSPFAGSLADRHDRRRLLLVTQSLQAVATAILMVTWIVGVRDAATYVALAAVAGFFSGLNLPGWKAFVSDLVPRDRLLNAVTLNSMQFNFSRMVGPALAGAALAAFGPAWAFFINLISFGAVLGALAIMDVATPVKPTRDRFRPLRDFVDTVGWLRDQPGISQAIVTAGLVGLLGMPIQVLAVVFAEEVFDGSARTYGFMLTTIGLGAVLTAPFLAGRGSTLARSQLQGIALCSYALGITGFALAPVLPIAFVALLLVGSAHLTSASLLNTTVQVQVTEERRAKVLATHTMVITLSSPIGQLVLGAAMERFGPRPTITAAGLLMAAIAGLFIASGRLRRLDGEHQPTDPLSPSP